MRFTITAWVIFPCLASCVAGCGGDAGRNAAKSRYALVEGRLLIGGKPVPFASLAFHPLDGERSARCAVGISKSDGTFRLTTSEPNDGAVPGDYVVTVLWPNPELPVDECDCPDPTEHDFLHGHYADRNTSDLRATIRRGENRITLTLKDSPGEL